MASSARHSFEVVLKDTGSDAKRLVEELKERRVPCVLYDIGETAEHISRVKIRYGTGMRRMAAHLYSLGHRRMANGSRSPDLGEQRPAGARALPRAVSQKTGPSAPIGNDSPMQPNGKQKVAAIPELIRDATFTKNRGPAKHYRG